MKKYHCIVAFDKEKLYILFCKRKKEPYKDLYNFAGGKVELGETDEDAAFRNYRKKTES